MSSDNNTESLQYELGEIFEHLKSASVHLANKVGVDNPKGLWKRAVFQSTWNQVGNTVAKFLEEKGFFD